MSRAARQGKAIHWVEAFGMSAAFHVGVVFFALDFINDIRFTPDPNTTRPDILVTSLSFDEISVPQPPTEDAGSTDTDAELPEDVEPDTLTGNELDAEEADQNTPDVVEELDQAEELTPEIPETLEPETTDAVEPETLEPETAEVAETDALAPDEIEPETLAAQEVEPETLTPEPVVPDTVEAETLAAASPALDEPQALAPVAPALTPEPLSPLRPQNDTVAALAPVASAGTTSLAALAPVASATPERLTASPSVPAATAVQPLATASVQTVAPRVTRPALPAPPPRQTATAATAPLPGSPAAVVGELIARIRARVGDPCLVAMPQQAADGAPELVMLSSSETAIGNFATAVLAEVDPRPGQRAVLVDPRQCEALTYIRENPSYPAFRLTVGLTTDQLSGQSLLQGAIGRGGGNYISLLVVDDNGVVQVLNQYLTFAGGEARFEVPMRRAGNPRDTSHMLIAIASNARPATLDSQNGQEAETFFAALRAELGSRAPIVMIPFDVR